MLIELEPGVFNNKIALTTPLTELKITTGRVRGRRRAINDIVADVDKQISGMSDLYKEVARYEAATAMTAFAVGSAIRVGTKTVTNGALLFSASTAALLLTNPVGWGILGGTAILAAVRAGNEVLRIGEFVKAAENIGVDNKQK